MIMFMEHKYMLHMWLGDSLFGELTLLLYRLRPWLRLMRSCGRYDWGFVMLWVRCLLYQELCVYGRRRKNQRGRWGELIICWGSRPRSGASGEIANHGLGVCKSHAVQTSQRDSVGASNVVKGILPVVHICVGGSRSLIKWTHLSDWGLRLVCLSKTWGTIFGLFTSIFGASQAEQLLIS